MTREWSSFCDRAVCQVEMLHIMKSLNSYHSYGVRSPVPSEVAHTAPQPSGIEAEGRAGCSRLTHGDTRDGCLAFSSWNLQGLPLCPEQVLRRYL